MKNITDEEFMVIMNYLNKHTSPEETQKIELQRATDSVWEAKIKKVEEMRFKQRYAEAQQSLQTVFSEPLTSDTGIVSLWRSTPAWLSAASVVLLLAGAYMGYYYFQETTQTIVQKHPDSTSKVKEPIREVAQAPLEQTLLTYINKPIDTEGIPQNLRDEANGINKDDTRKKMIRRLEKMTRGSQVPTSPLPDEITYGSGSDTLLTLNDSTRTIIKEKAYQQLLLGIGYLKNQETEKALKTLNQIPERVLSQDVRWYKALAYLQLGAVEKARAELSTLSKSRYQLAAQELLKAF